MADKKRWTMLVYMAGDNNLDAEAVADLKEMLKVGAGPDISVVVQIDRSRHAHTRRHVIPEKGHTSYEDALKTAEVLPEINTGDPKTLANFLSWGRAQFPADRLALVIWNHGWGWRPYDLEEAGRAAPGAPLPDERLVSLEAPRRRTFRTLAPFRHALFKHGAALREALDIISYVGVDRQTPLPRVDALEMRELARALSLGLGEGDALDLLGFDACQMAGLEVGYELRRHARVLVGSEEDEQGEGWPYHAILKDMHESPQMGAEKLAVAIAKSYVRWAAAIEAREDRQQAYTSSATRLSQLEDLARTTARLGEVLTAVLPKELVAIRAVVQSVDRMPGDRQAADLGHFAKLVARHVKSKKTQSVAADLIDVSRNVVLYAGRVGEAVQHATGLTVYLPTDRSDFRAYRRSYAALSFLADHPAWLGFLDALHSPQYQLPT